MSRDPAITSRIMSKVRSEGGKAEVLLGKAMWALKLRYRKQYPILGKPDYVLTKSRIAIFCDGDFWHGRTFQERVQEATFNNRDYWISKISRNMERDELVNDKLHADGWLVMRFWESDILNNANECARQVYEMHILRREGIKPE